MFDNMEMLLGIRLASLALGLGGVFFASHMLLTVSAGLILTLPSSLIAYI